jgi:hypothetical protein
MLISSNATPDKVDMAGGRSRGSDEADLEI